jgi:hypothetical protein
MSKLTVAASRGVPNCGAAALAVGKLPSSINAFCAHKVAIFAFAQMLSV